MLVVILLSRACEALTPLRLWQAHSRLWLCGRGSDASRSFWPTATALHDEASKHLRVSALCRSAAVCAFFSPLGILGMTGNDIHTTLSHPF